MAFPTKITQPEEGRVIYVSDSGDNTYNGVTQDKAVKDYQRAKTLAQALVPSPDGDNPVTITTDTTNSSTDETIGDSQALTLFAGCTLDFDNISYRPSLASAVLTMANNATANVRVLENGNTSFPAAEFDGSLFGSLNAATLQHETGPCLDHKGLSGVNFANVEAFIFGTYAVNNTSTFGDVFTVDFDRAIAQVNSGVGFIQNSTTRFVLNGSTIEDNSLTSVKGVQNLSGDLDANISLISCPGGTSIDLQGGTTTLRAGKVEGDIVVGSGASATIEISEFDHNTYTVTNTGTLNGRIGDVRYGTWKIVDDDVINIESWQDVIDHLTPGDSTKAYQVFGNITATDNTSLDPNGAPIYGNVGRSFDGFTSSEANHVFFSSDQSGSLSGLKFDINGTSSKVFDVTGDTGFETWAISDCSFNGNESLGSFDNLYALDEQNNVYQNNAGGLTCNDVARYASKSSPWIQNNTATTNMTFTGAMDLLRFHGGGMGVASGKTGISVAGITSLSSFGQLDGGVAFTGAGTYVDDLTTFDANEWSVEAFGIDQIYKDTEAFGNVRKDGSTTTTISASGTPVKVTGASTLGETFRADDDGGTDNRIRYTGVSKRTVTVSGSISIDNFSGGNDNVSVYVAKNGTAITSSRVQFQVGGVLDTQASGFNETVQLEQNDYVEVWVANDDDTTDLVVRTYNFTMR